MSRGDTSLEILAAIALSGRENPLRMKLTYEEEQSMKTKKPSYYIIWASGSNWTSYVSHILPLYLNSWSWIAITCDWESLTKSPSIFLILLLYHVVSHSFLLFLFFKFLFIYFYFFVGELFLIASRVFQFKDLYSYLPTSQIPR